MDWGHAGGVTQEDFQGTLPHREQTRVPLSSLVAGRKCWWETASVFGLVSTGTIQMERRSNYPDCSGPNSHPTMACLVVSLALIIALPEMVSHTVFPPQHPVISFSTTPRPLTALKCDPTLGRLSVGTDLSLSITVVRDKWQAFLTKIQWVQN